MMFMLYAVLVFLICIHGQLYPYGEENGDTAAATDDVTQIVGNSPVRMYGSVYDHMFICPNGMISLGEAYCTEVPESFPYTGYPAIAPFWIHHKYRRRSAIWYRVTSDPDLLDLAAGDFDGYFSGCKADDFRPDEMIIITWADVDDVDACEKRDIDEDMCNCLFNPPDYVDRLTLTFYCDCVLETGTYLQHHVNESERQYHVDSLAKEKEDAERFGSRHCEIYALGTDVGADNYFWRMGRIYTRSENDDQEDRNTYQLMLMTNGGNTYVQLNYGNVAFTASRIFIRYPLVDDRRQAAKNMADYSVFWDPPVEYPLGTNATVGFTLGDGESYYIHPYSEVGNLPSLETTSNVGQPGRHMYKISGGIIKDPQCAKLKTSPDYKTLLYPFGPRNGDEPGQAYAMSYGDAIFPTLEIEEGIPFFGDTYHNVSVEVDGRVWLSNDEQSLIEPEIDVFRATHALFNSKSISGEFFEYYAEIGNLVRSNQFWYRLTSHPEDLARARYDVHKKANNAECLNFEPTSVVILTWYRVMTADDCVNYGLTDEYCDCLYNNWGVDYEFNYEIDTYNPNPDLNLRRCACLFERAGREGPFYGQGITHGLFGDKWCNTDSEMYQNMELSDVFVDDAARLKENTYQAVLITDGNITYLILNYDQIEWTHTNYLWRDRPFQNGRGDEAQVGMNNGKSGDEEKRFVHPLSDRLLKLVDRSNVRVKGRYMYLVSGEDIKDASTCDALT